MADRLLSSSDNKWLYNTVPQLNGNKSGRRAVIYEIISPLCPLSLSGRRPPARSLALGATELQINLSLIGLGPAAGRRRQSPIDVFR